VVKQVFLFWQHNKLIGRDHIQWEIGMGVPVVALAFCGYFKHVVASDIDFETYKHFF